jgi:CBS domain-containing protein
MTAADVMSRELLMIPELMSLAKAAHLLCQNQVSGAPVVNKDGTCVGILSAFDFVQWVENGHRLKEYHAPLESEFSQPWQMVSPEDLPDDVVANHMTEHPVTVHPETPIVELARMMIDAHIHRILVVDDEDRPIGLVSSTDLLAALAYT